MRDKDADLREELRAHLKMAIEDRVARGQPRREAEAAARRELGNLSQIQEADRDVRGGRWLAHAAQDTRYALRLFRRNPGFAAVALLSLALGIGANTALFSIVNAVLLRPLPYAHADRLVTVWARTPSNPQTLVSYPEFDTFRRDSTSFDALAVWLGNSVNLTGVSEPQRLLGAFASRSFFDVLGLKAERGRLFTDQDSEPGSVQPES